MYKKQNVLDYPNTAITVVCREGRSQVELWATEIHRLLGGCEAPKRSCGDLMTRSAL